MSLFDWIVFCLCWSLPFACYAIRRWRVRVYLARHDVRRVNNFPRSRP